MDFRFITADDREKLYNEVWAEPVATVAKRYDLSDNGLRKHCKRLGIPLPPNGYWAKVKAGQKVYKPDLPKVTGELKKHIRQYAIKYRTDLETLTDAELMVEEELSLLRDETKIFIKEKCAKIQIKGQLRNPQHLITEHKEEILYRRKRDKALKQAKYSPRIYESVKSNYRENEAILPIFVSESSVNRAYRILNAVMYALEDMEGHTRVSLESGRDVGVFIIMHASFRFEITEETPKKRASTETKTELVLTLSPKSWFNDIVADTMKYKDDDKEPLEDRIGRIIYDMFVMANKLTAADKLEQRKEKRRWEEYKRQRRLEEMRKGELQEIKLLEQAASDWDKAEKIRRFADNMELKIKEIEDLGKKENLVKWLKWVRDKADWLDPLTKKEDELLGKSQYLFDVIHKMDL